LNNSAIVELRTIRERTGLDLCGEEGEYHTLVSDGPRFTQSIDIRSYSKRVSGSLAYMEIHKSVLFDHAADRLPRKNRDRQQVPQNTPRKERGTGGLRSISAARKPV
jgi:hypothetical protein